MAANEQPQDDEQLRYPSNHVLAVFDSKAKLQAAITALGSSGYAANEIATLSGPDDVHHLDAAAGERGFWGRLHAGAVNMGDDASANIAHYREVLSGGGAIIAVKVSDDGAEPLVRVLAAHGGSFIYHYGRLTIEKLS